MRADSLSIGSHARQVVSVMSRYASSGSSLCLAAMAGSAQYREWQHYPDQDARDHLHQTEFYYHAHSIDERVDGEHGHFHVFARTRRGRDFHHVIGISLDVYGLPFRLFLTNQWVTGEKWQSTKEMTPLIEQFHCQVAGRLAPVSRWLTSVVHLYRDEIITLHQRKDRWLASRLKKTNDLEEVLSSKRHQVVAQVDIDLVRRLALFS